MKLQGGALALVIALLASGCAAYRPPVDIPARLYALQDGTVTPGTFTWQAKLDGPVSVRRTDELCTGEFRTIIEGKTSVGIGTSGSRWGGLFGSVYTASTADRAQKGVAIAACPSGFVYECEYVANLVQGGVTGYGACKDNRSGTYRLMF